jgi:hypothetical protein
MATRVKKAVPAVQDAPVQTVPTLGESIKAAHLAAKQANPTIRTLPRKGDIVALLAEDGEILRTGEIVRKPSSLVLIRWNGLNNASAYNTDILTQIEPNVWKMA